MNSKTTLLLVCLLMCVVYVVMVLRQLHFDIALNRYQLFGAAKDVHSNMPCNLSALPFVRLENNVLILSGHRAYATYGNYLSLYYNYRGMAKILGLCFQSDRRGLSRFANDNEWLNYLPERYCNPSISFNSSLGDTLERLNSRSAKIAKETCESCIDIFAFPHECNSFLSHVRTEMNVEIKRAIELHSHKWNITLPRFEAKSSKKVAVIYSRCKEKDAIMSHPLYGPTAFSFYIPAASSSDHIIFVARAEPGVCLDILKGLLHYLKKLNPHLTHEIQHGTAFQDYATLVLAPSLFIDRSSFGFTAALANENTVYSPRQGSAFPPLDKFIWNKDIQVLIPSLGREKLGIENSTLTSDNKRAILDWLSLN